jgi:rubrerythrin
MAGTAGTVGGLALGGAFATPALAGDDDDDDEPAEMPEDEFEDDVAILNYARTLEFLEYRFYERGLDNISEEDLTDSHPIHHFGDPVTDHVYDHLGRIRDHEETHAETLGAVVEDLGGDPVEEPEFDFGSAVEDAEEFIATAVQLEDTGVSAYAGAAPDIETEALIAPALSIHSVEARHASYLRVLDGQIPFPEAFDDPRSRSEVLDIASGFIAE